MTQWFDPLLRFRPRRAAPVLAAVVACLCGTTAAHAQVPFETAGGTRALGMGGAFVAVADDASATWWNPAGLSTLLGDGVIDGGTESLVEDAAGPIDRGAWRARPLGVAIALPMGGFSFNRLSVKEIRHSATAATERGRQDTRHVALARAFQSTGVGVTLVQSLGDLIVVGTTLRVLNGSAGAAAVDSDEGIDAALDAAGGLDRRGRTVVDADLGALAFAGPVRLALVARNLGAHRFETGIEGEDVELARQVRVGAALGGGPAWRRRDWTLAVDADLTTTHAADGDRRSVALGGERWLGGRRVALRAGARAQTVGDLRPVATAGASVAVRTGTFVEGQVSGGGDHAVNGWSLAARVTF